MPTIDKERWLRVSPLLDELLDTPAAMRPARLALLAQEEPALAKDLRLLLAADAWIGRTGFLEGSALGGLRAARRSGSGSDQSLSWPPQGLRPRHVKR